MEPSLRPGVTFPHGFTFAGHPVAAALALANLDILDRTGDPLVTSVAMSQDWDMAWALIELGAAYDYEGGRSRRPLSLALKGRYPAPDSPLYPYKRKVWQLLKDKGLPVPPLEP